MGHHATGKVVPSGSGEENCEGAGDSLGEVEDHGHVDPGDDNEPWNKNPGPQSGAGADDDNPGPQSGAGPKSDASPDDDTPGPQSDAGPRPDATPDAGPRSDAGPDDDTPDDSALNNDSDLDQFGFDQFVFDDDFVRAAEVREPTAAERQRATRQANLERLLQDSDSQQENLLHEYRRFAPLPGNDDSFEDSDPNPSGEYYFGDDFSGQALPNNGAVFDLGFDDAPDFDHEDYDLWIRNRRRRRNRRVLGFVSVIVVISVLVVYALSQFFTGVALRNANSASGSTSGPEKAVAPGSRAPGDPQDAALDARRPKDWPPVGKWASTLLGTPEAVPAGGGPHDFIMFQSDGISPVAYDPCRVIHYVTHGADTAADGSERLIKDAIATISKLTGLVFVNDGGTSEAPSDDRAAYQPDRYGKRWAPVLISWSTASESPRLGVITPDGAPAGTTLDVLGYAGSVSAGFTTKGSGTVHADEPKGLGLAGSPTSEPTIDVPSADPTGMVGGLGAIARLRGSATTQFAIRADARAQRTPTDNERIYVTGSVVLDRENFATMLGQFDGYARARATVLHELGHLVGLNHVNDANELMAPTLQGTLTEFAAGDREGLAALGSGACVPGI